MLYYLSKSGDSLDKRAFLKDFQEESIPEEVKEYGMTLAQQWIEEGREEGIEKGREGQLMETISKLLKLKFQKNYSMESWIESLAEYPHNSLETISERILFAETPEKIFAGLSKKPS